MSKHVRTSAQDKEVIEAAGRYEPLFQPTPEELAKDIGEALAAPTVSTGAAVEAEALRSAEQTAKEVFGPATETSILAGYAMVKIVPNDRGNPPGKLAEAEIHFTGGLLGGLKLIGFSVWERRQGNGRNVTFPARQYSVNGERRSFALLRPIADTGAQEVLRAYIVKAYGDYGQGRE